MTIHQIAFSPTGGTRRVSELLCSGIEAKSILTELCVKEEELCLPSIAAGDLVVVSMPVYAGRVPALAVERLNAVESNGATCVIVAVYGNRAYEDALVEMQDVTTAQGFNVVAAVAANAEHSICRMYGAGRPDAADARELASFGRAILERVQGGKPFGRLALPGNRPYKQGCSGPFPVANQDVRNAVSARANARQVQYLPTIQKTTTTSSASAVCGACRSARRMRGASASL